MTKDKFAQIIFGILIFEDIFAILILVLLSSIAITGALQVEEVLVTVTKLSSFLVVSLLLGILIVPKLLSYVAKFNNNEMLLVSVLGLCFGFCLFVAKLNYSIALGAFIIGAIVAESSQLRKIEHLINPIRDMFSAIFFVSVGILFNFPLLINYLVPVAIITIVVVVGKILSSSLGVILTGKDGRTAMRVGMGLAQIGEFSFIIASLGITLGVTDNFLFSIAVGVSVITTLLTPYLIKYSDKFTKVVAFFIPKSISNTFNLYVAWMQNIQPLKNQVSVAKNIKHIVIHIMINLLIVLAIFLSSSYLAKSNLGHILIKITHQDTQKTILWAIALIISLPFLVAVYQKIKSISMILSELSLKNYVDNRLTITVRRIISEMIPAISIFGIMVFICLLSTSILPPLEWLFVLLAIIALIVVFIFPWLVKIHARLQTSLMESIKDTKDD